MPKDKLKKELLRYLLVLFFFKFLFSMGYLFMDDLTRAVSQFLPSAPVGMSGGFNQPPAPEGSSAGIPLFFDQQDINLDQPGPAALEGEGLAVRDVQEERERIQALQEDPVLGKAKKRSYLLQEEIIIEVKKAISPGEAISNRDIREGVELYLYDLIENADKLASSNNKQLGRILESVSKKSKHFYQILETIDSLGR